jgi:phosphoribosyl 1,2-cyclic phosphodiesterase
VSDGYATVMLECGLPWRKIRELLNFNTYNIAGILLTHRHMDHAKGAADAAKSGHDIYASKGTFDVLKVPEHRMKIVAAGCQFEIGTWTILPFETIHDTEGSLGFYMVNTLGEAFLFMTDTGFTKVRFANLHVIACECNFIDQILTDNILSGALPAVVGHRVRRAHMSLKVFIDMLRSNDLSKCSAIHLLHMSSGNADEARMIREIQEQTGIPTRAA